MNREDFMADYPLRTGGRMTTVYGEDVRNYHWEYYREMTDMRNDVANSALMKNPFLYPLSFSALNTPVEKNVWQKLQFLQIGNKLTGAINGIKMVEFTDDGFTNNGLYSSLIKAVQAPEGKFEAALLTPRPGWSATHLFGGRGAFPFWHSSQGVPPNVPVVFYVNGTRSRKLAVPSIEVKKEGGELKYFV